MCGHIGFISTNPFDGQFKENFMKYGLYIDALRGEDATGICAVPINRSALPMIYKRGIPSPDFLRVPLVDSLLTHSDQYMVMMGHNRKATLGAINDANAHPFQKDHIYLAHNGTLSSTLNLPSKSTHDSYAICESFAEESADTILPLLDGSYALAWYDSLLNTFFLARNAERPMYFALSTDNKTLIYGSEQWMLEGACVKAQNNAWAKTTIEFQQTMELQKGWKVGFGLGGETLNYSETQFKIKPKAVRPYYGGAYGQPATSTWEKIGAKRNQWFEFIVEKVIRNSYLTNGKYEYTVEGSQYLGGALDEWVTVKSYYIDEVFAKSIKEADVLFGRMDNLYTNDGNLHVTIGKNSLQRKVPPKLDTYKVPERPALPAPVEVQPEDTSLDWAYGPDNKVISEEEFKKLVADGCAICGMQIGILDDADISWTADDKPMCPQCTAYAWGVSSKYQ